MISRWPLRLAVGGGLFLLARSAFAGGKSATGERGPLTEDDRLRFVSDVYTAVASTWPESSAASRQLILSQAAFESGWGVGTAYRLGNNPLNVTAGSASVPSISGPDTECDAGGVCRPITQKFRAYRTLADAISDYLSLLQTSRYRSAYGLLVAGDVGFAEALGRAGYYTLPIPQYVASFKGVLAGVQKRLAALQLVA